MALNGWAECLQKQREIDRLTEELQRLKQQLRDQERQAAEGFFGSATPSAKRPVQANITPAKEPKRQSARPGPLGAGRQAFEASQAERVVDVAAEVGDRCPDCDAPWEEKGADGRLVLDSHPVKAERLRYRLPKKYGPQCRRSCQPWAPAVLPKSLYGNQLIATATTMHDLHGIPLGRVCEQMGLGPGSLVEIFQRLARLCAGIPEQLVAEYRQAPVKHADETGWRTTGHHGYTWLFATPRLSLFLCRQTRAASVPQHVFGKTWLPGCLVVDRDGGYNKVPCAIQYGYSHLLREVPDLEKEFPDAAEVRAFVSTVAPQLALAMGLRAQPLSDPEFARQAAALKAQLMASREEPAQHLGIRRLQESFRATVNRLYHWAEDRQIPAENNLAERDLRPIVIARKVSFGSQSDAGAHTRGVLKWAGPSGGFERRLHKGFWGAGPETPPTRRDHADGRTVCVSVRHVSSTPVRRRDLDRERGPGSVVQVMRAGGEHRQINLPTFPAPASRGILSRMNTPPATNLYKRHRFPAEIVSHGVWLYFRFCLSYREVQELMAERGVILTYEAVRSWCRKFGQAYANQLRRRRPRPGDTWHLDEVFLTIRGERHYLWRAVDQDGNVLDILVQCRRDEAAAKKFFHRLRKGLRYVPPVIITDQLKSYGAAMREILPSVEHRQHRYLNNRAENSHQPTRQWEQWMQHFKSAGRIQRFLAAYDPIAQHFRPRRHLLPAPIYHQEMTQRFQIWRAVTGLAPAA